MPVSAEARLTSLRDRHAADHGKAPFVVFVFTRCLPCMRRPAKTRALPARRAVAYARTAPLVLWMMTSPSVTFGGFLRILSSFSSRTHSDATRVDSSA
jgi:hypothetical protein